VPYRRRAAGLQTGSQWSLVAISARVNSVGIDVAQVAIDSPHRFSPMTGVISASIPLALR
jgi:hypothetical protein